LLWHGGWNPTSGIANQAGAWLGSWLVFWVPLIPVDANPER
jgi:hypothetical protein